MERKSIKKILEKIRNLERRRRRILQKLLREDPILSGSLSQVERRCGKPNCFCAKGQRGHRQLQVVFLEEGRRRCRTIRNADIDQVRLWDQDSKKFRNAVGDLKAIQNEQLDLLNGLKEARSQIYRSGN